eukprot:TRINITY_DN21252_c0_g2_i1.p1 TRINITY_DN21252_c0_g2~~TRINITY_DN21252_c0_g2_i1.p1  ORF type:complete len:210 (+),score=46.11 TRINITY_DN21252_c0_g2_i1:171-800(+)
MCIRDREEEESNPGWFSRGSLWRQSQHTEHDTHRFRRHMTWRFARTLKLLYQHKSRFHLDVAKEMLKEDMVWSIIEVISVYKLAIHNSMEQIINANWWQRESNDTGYLSGKAISECIERCSNVLVQQPKISDCNESVRKAIEQLIEAADGADRLPVDALMKALRRTTHLHRDVITCFHDIQFKCFLQRQSVDEGIVAIYELKQLSLIHI